MVDYAIKLPYAANYICPHAKWLSLQYKGLNALRKRTQVTVFMRCELDKQFFSHNVRGYNKDKEAELLDFMCTITSSHVEFKKLGFVVKMHRSLMKTMVLSLFIMDEFNLVAGEEDFLVAWLLFSVLMQKKHGVQQIRKFSTSVIEFLRLKCICRTQKSEW